MSIRLQTEILKKRRTKIVATLGPATSDPATLSSLLKAGVNMFRLNMSHGEHATHAALVEAIRSAVDATGIQVTVMADLCGPKIRTGKFKQGSATLVSGNKVTMTVRKVEGDAGLIPSQYRLLNKDAEVGDSILLNDGLISLRVEAIDGTEVHCRIVHGGVISNHKGINLPDSLVSAPALTDKDKADARFALAQGVDYLSLSFVRTAREVKQLRRMIQREGSSASIISKIETPLALQNIQEILQASDAIMVARGDLGVELKPEEVPVAQMQLIDEARRMDRPVIVATQVLESMIEHARPTRAEVSDISYAVSSGADALMLSAETSVGKYPVKAVQTMDRAIRYTESYHWASNTLGDIGPAGPASPPLPVGDAVSNATSQLSKDLLVRAVVVISRSGMSAISVSAARPSAPIIAISDDAEVCRKMLLMWGVIPCKVKTEELDQPNQLARKHAKGFKLAGRDDYILLVQGFSTNKKMNAPSVSVLQV